MFLKKNEYWVTDVYDSISYSILSKFEVDNANPYILESI